ncbi:MAG TPA: hypothetical protein VFU07_03050 [Candidatus Lumbricidophila sp.]|nr:hypothetical protein [Candidatus Lumbricidophila sp.]
MMTWVRHSTTGAIGAAIGIAGVLLALHARREGLNLWTDYITGLSQASIYTGTLAAGVSAWEARRTHKPLVARLLVSSRPVVAVRVAHFASVAAPLALGFVIGVALLWAIGLATGVYGSPFIPWIGALVGAILAASAFGYGVSAVSRNQWYSPPLAAILFFASYVILQLLHAPNWSRALFPVIMNVDSEFVAHVSTTMFGQIVAYLSFVILVPVLIAVAAKRRRGPSGFILVATLIAGVGLGASLIGLRNGQYVTGQNPGDFVCEGARPQVCVNPGYRAGLAKLVTAFAELSQKSSDSDLIASRLEQQVEGIGDSPTRPARSLYIEDLSESGIAFSVARYVDRYGGGIACRTSEHTYDQHLANAVVQAWLSNFDELGFGGASPMEPGAAEFRRLTALGPVAARSWFGNHVRQYMSCGLTLADLP